MTDEVIEVKKLNDLEDEIKKLKLKAEKAYILFRGQQDSTWDLETTLERHTDKTISIEKYNKFLYSAYNKITTFTEKKWNLSPYTDSNYKPHQFFNEKNKTYCDDFYQYYNKNPHLFFIPPNIEFMIYARHHGLPTPLLDWTSSLYIALFFAFQNKIKGIKSVAIFVLVDKGSRDSINGSAVLTNSGKNYLTHKRHLLQAAEYTCAAAKHGDEIYYCKHADAIKMQIIPSIKSIN